MRRKTKESRSTLSRLERVSYLYRPGEFKKGRLEWSRSLRPLSLLHARCVLQQYKTSFQEDALINQIKTRFFSWTKDI